jgi:phospholipid/cholesterol/gamma-HCH transport system permease protein
MVATGVFAKPVREVGGFFALSLDTLVQAVRPPFAWREFILQVWFIARVSVVPAMLLTIPFSVITAFNLNVLLGDIGAADLSGAGVGWGTVTETGPIVTVFVVAGAAATAVCADLGARTIREEIDAMKVMGINPIQALVVPRVAALTLGSVLLNAIVCLVGITGGYLFAVYVQHVTPGAFAASMTLICGLADTAVSFLKAALFGLAAGLIACYKGTTAGGGPQGVGNAVNETVVYSFMALMLILVLTNVFNAQVKL